ncbi:Glucose/galactose transporter [Fibrella aestuarina BUZ 2]|uniref:Glucose/galactose transporter n=1 Tax=Fibrella aestuarina BUZ 2 TaxID=1166018 RepID=I0KE29_9BACT|nr:L-fucose:H+ symporter permease [Fibrella aestuarina]CCH02382.1 Glucose/galactose transporter [Fibrella aestuarina BUZ 2]
MTSPTPASATAAPAQRYTMAFALVTSLFFLWAFVHNLEPILIPHLKKACQLTDLQSAMIDSSVYLAYFLMAIPAGMVMKRFGYKQGILVGLSLYALGALLFWPAASTRLYALFLGALFIIASGCAFLETAANPYVTLLGPPESATTRLNLSQSFNGLGAFLAPLLGGKLILSGIEHSPDELAAMSPAALDAYLQFEANSVKMPYLVIAIVVLLVLALVALTKLPDVRSAVGERVSSLRTALQHPQLTGGIIAQFFYVGAQVCVTSFFIRFAKFTSNVPERQAAEWLSYALLGFLIGRFVGTFLTRYVPAGRLLAIYSLISLLLLAVAVTAKSDLAVWAVFAVPFFESIMFPTIFALGINRLTDDRELGASLLVMAIAGGAFFPLLMGWISDQSNIQVAYSVPMLCFLVVAWYGWRGHKTSVEG